MSDKTISHLFIDTSYLRTAGFNHPDFRRLLHFSKSDQLKIYVSHIAWEERRTQFLEAVLSKIDKVTSVFDTLKSEIQGNFILTDLPFPTLNIWSKSDVDERSRKAMEDFAVENKIAIILPAQDHIGRAWDRYFTVAPPFNPAEPRENRRKDIPDSWIFEVAIDLYKKHSGLLALCHDGRLLGAMQSYGIRVFKEASLVIEEIDRPLTAGAADSIAVKEHVSVSILEKATVAVPESELDIEFKGMREQLKSLDTKILGYVGYLEAPSKDQLFDLLAKSGISGEIAKNAMERLALAGILTDTGNHYLARNRDASELAAKLVETEIINFLGEM